MSIGKKHACLDIGDVQQLGEAGWPHGEVLHRNSNLQKEDTCLFCEHLVDAFNKDCNDTNARFSFILGELASGILNCPIHKSLISRLFGHPITGKEENLAMAWKKVGQLPIVELRLHKKPSGGGAIETLESTELALLHEPSTIPAAGQARMVDGEWINTQLLKFWKASCDRHHEACKMRPVHSLDTAWPSWLVDVTLNCIVAAPKNVEYFALSYVWGGIEPLSLTKENIDELQIPGSLNSPSFTTAIPATIKHAISLSWVLGLRYLWVDSLCIVQDDDDSAKHSELAKMAGIYANASVTLVAANGRDAEYGIRGLQGISEPRQFNQEILQLSSDKRVVKPSLTQPNQSSKNTWETRGWTFQEQLFSRRRIIFYDEVVGWECPFSCAKEYLFMDNEETDWVLPGILSHLPGYTESKFTAPVADIFFLATSVDAFSRRELTYPEDSLDAFSGLLSAVSSQYEGGFCFGLPVLFFSLALLWQSGEVVPRTAKKYKTSSHLPSWSWCGWQGDINWYGWDPIVHAWDMGTALVQGQPADIEQSFHTTITSSIQWYSHASRGDVGSPIQSTWSEYQQRYSDNLTETPPQTWTRHLTQDLLEKLSYCDDCQNNERVSIHDSPGRTTCECGGQLSPSSEWGLKHIPLCYYVNDYSDRQYKFPVPVAGAHTGQPYQQVSHRFISCSTKRAWLWASERFDAKYCPTAVAIRDDSGKWVGGLNYQAQIPPRGKLGASIELVEIGKGETTFEKHGMASLAFFEWSHDECPKDRELYEYYAVLWVEWESGTAYRQGMGHILKDSWESLKKEGVELILG